MSTSQPKQSGDEASVSAPRSNSSVDLEVQEFDLEHSINHTLVLQDTNYTKDTVVAAEEFSRREIKEEELGKSEEAKHVGFWHSDLNNVRLHVLKLWARTGETNQNLS